MTKKLPSGRFAPRVYGQICTPCSEDRHDPAWHGELGCLAPVGKEPKDFPCACSETNYSVARRRKRENARKEKKEGSPVDSVD